MTVLSGLTIRDLNIIEPFVERTQHVGTGTSYGMSYAGYDLRLDQNVRLRPGLTYLASTLERFTMPNDVMGVVHDKSTWARKGLSVQNTVIEPGWTGWLTLELLWLPVHDDKDYMSFRLQAGSPIAQVVFHRIDRDVGGYSGKYQNQERGPQGSRFTETS
jgi:dCTP deaminase